MTGEILLITKLSDEFLRVATKEINEELAHIDELLTSCNSDSDIIKNCKELEGHFHKIKGLSPMMNKKRIGKISDMIDSILKHIIDGKNIVGIHEVLIESNNYMINDMKDQGSGYENLENKIKEEYSDFIE